MQNFISLRAFNQLPDSAAEQYLLQCCSAQTWVDRMLRARPFSDLAHLLAQAGEQWQGLAESDYLQAFDGHPKIGDVDSLREKYADTKAMASGEQAAVDDASEMILRRLSEGNRAYEEKTGFIFIICATGKSAGQMLSLLESRLQNPRAEEIVNACAEQEKITALRLQKLLAEQ